MKKVFLVLAVTLFPMQAPAQTSFSTSNSVSQFASNIGSKVTIQLRSDTPSSSRGNFLQTFSYNNGVTNFNRSFNITGSTNFKIDSQINSTTTTFTNNPKFKW
jgi:hypothetical protein